MPALDASSFGLLNNILSSTGADITSQLQGPVPGLADISKTTASALAAPNFAMPGGGGFYSTPMGIATRGMTSAQQFQPAAAATVANAPRMIDLATKLGTTGEMQGRSYGMQQQFTAEEQQIQAELQQKLAEIIQSATKGIGQQLGGGQSGGFLGMLGGLAGDIGSFFGF